MKPALMLALAAFLLGLTGGAGFMFVKETRPGVFASPLADSLTAMAARSDSLAGREPAAPAPDAVPAPVAVDTVAAEPVAEETVAAAEPAPAEPQRPEMEPERLAKLFGQMQPREAARVMTQMTDPEIQMILSLLGDRQASGILGSLPPERAAAVSRLVIGGDERTIQ